MSNGKEFQRTNAATGNERRPTVDRRNGGTCSVRWQCHACLCCFSSLSLLCVLVHGQVTIIFVVSVCLSVCLFVCAEFFSAVFDPISIKLGHML